jgi:hypothetical protein
MFIAIQIKDNKTLNGNIIALPWWLDYMIVTVKMLKDI